MDDEDEWVEKPPSHVSSKRRVERSEDDRLDRDSTKRRKKDKKARRVSSQDEAATKKKKKKKKSSKSKHGSDTREDKKRKKKTQRHRRDSGKEGSDSSSSSDNESLHSHSGLGRVPQQTAANKNQDMADQPVKRLTAEQVAANRARILGAEAGRPVKGPMTPAEYAKIQSQIRRVVDPETGRARLIKGTGEVLEEIVSREQHQAINRTSTMTDGQTFANRTLGHRM